MQNLFRFPGHFLLVVFSVLIEFYCSKGALEIFHGTSMTSRLTTLSRKFFRKYFVKRILTYILLCHALIYDQVTYRRNLQKLKSAKVTDLKLSDILIPNRRGRFVNI
jgi:hypothetical protein